MLFRSTVTPTRGTGLGFYNYLPTLRASKIQIPQTLLRSAQNLFFSWAPALPYFALGLLFAHLPGSRFSSRLLFYVGWARFNLYTQQLSLRTACYSSGFLRLRLLYRLVDYYA